MIRIFDAHADTPYELWIRKEHLKNNTCHIAEEKASMFSDYRQVFAFCSLAGSKWAISKDEFYDCYSYFLRELNDQQFLSAHLSIEGPEIIDCDPEQIAALSQKGFVMSTLTWNADNSLAGFHRSEKGLTDLGRAFVKSAQSSGVYIDVSHLSEAAFWDLMKVTQKPIVASHSNCRRIWDHSRNLTDDQLRAITDTDGLVGLNLYVPFLGERADFTVMLRHLEHMLELCGAEHICLGGDLDGCEILPEGFADLSGYASFYEFLHGKGFDEELLDKLFYRNLAQRIEGRH